ncbi:MAG: fatty acid desaturase, partial [bacterium]|nr:fatty acid desaturase [bacterium]
MSHNTKTVKDALPFNTPITFQSIKQILITLIPLAAIIAALTFFDHWAAYVLLVPVGSMFLLRTFILQHDCGHQALFRKSKTNNVLGSIMGVITLIPYHYWKWQHWMHHRGSGNLDKRGHGDILLLTVEEYKDKGKWGRFVYRAYRNPFIMCSIGPVYYFFIKIRFPFIMKKKQVTEKRSIMYTNFGIAGLLGL